MTNLAGKPPLGLKQPKPAKTPKPMRKISKKKADERHPLRENARGKPCQLQLPGCRGGTEHTVLAHYRMFGWAGAGQKPIDLLGCFACDLCHEKQEHHHPDATPENLLRAMGNTLRIQVADGLVEF